LHEVTAITAYPPFSRASASYIMESHLSQRVKFPHV
jgi:hypothetical protein